MPAVFQSTLAFLVVLGVLVFVHELGHYLAARWSRPCRGVLDRLRPGDRHLARPRRHGLEARLAAAGRLRQAARPGAAGSRGSDEPREPGVIGRAIMRRRGQGPRPDVASSVLAAPVADPDRWIAGRVFHEKSVGARALVVAAGPIANFLLAMVLFAAAVRDRRPAAHPAGGRRCAARQRGRARRHPGRRQDPLDRGDTDREFRGHPAHHHRASGRDAAHHDPARPTDAGAAGADRLTRVRAGARWECWASAAVRSSISGSRCPRH